MIKKVLCALAGLLWASGAFAAAPSYGDGNSFTASSGTTHSFAAVTLASPGYCIATFRLGQAADVVTGASDTAGNTWTEIGTGSQIGSSSASLHVFGAQVAAGTFTVSFSTSATAFGRLPMVCYTNAQFESASAMNAGASSTSQTSPSVTTSGADRLIVGIIATTSTGHSYAPANGETERFDLGGVQVQDAVAASAGSHSSSWTVSAASVSRYITIALAPSGGTPAFTGTIPTQTVTEGVAFSQSFASHFTNATSYALSGCTLPAGLSFNTSTATISGTSNTPLGATGCLIAASGSGAGTADSNVFAIQKAAPTGYSYLTADVPWPDGMRSVFEGASPAVVDGDILKYPLVTTSPIYPYTQFADGSYSIDAGSYLGRITWSVDVWDTSAGAWMGMTTMAANNQPPECVPEVQDLVLLINQAVSLPSPCPPDAEEDALVYSVLSGTLPTGLYQNASTGTIAGTPTAENESGVVVQLRACDPFEDCATYQRTFYVLDTITVPAACAAGEEALACESALLASWLEASTSYICSEEVASGEIISTSPAAGQEADALSAVELLVSGGSCSGIFSRGQSFDGWGRAQTIFLEDGEAVPSGAVFVAGVAYSQTGARYVAAWPSSNRAFYIAGFALRMDGAQLITTSGTAAASRNGMQLTERGEVLVTEEFPSIYVAGFGFDASGNFAITNSD